MLIHKLLDIRSQCNKRKKDIRLVVNNVVQEPDQVKHTRIGHNFDTIRSVNNGGQMYCVYLGRATATEAPGAGPWALQLATLLMEIK